MSRDDMAAAIDAFFESVERKAPEEMAFAEDVVFQSPMIKERRGRAAAVEYMGWVVNGVDAITIQRTIVEGDSVAVLFLEDTPEGPLQVMGLFRYEDGLIVEMRVFYDARPASERVVK